jgi:phosphoserine phosphatase
MLRRMALRCPHRVPLAFLRKRRDGKPAFKLYALQHSRLTHERLRRRLTLTAWIEEQAAAGRPVFLATGSPEDFASTVAAAHPYFAGVFATRPGVNMTGPTKATHLVEAFGERGFDYAGNSWADVAVWRHARRAIVCGGDAKLAAAAAEACEVERVFP